MKRMIYIALALSLSACQTVTRMSPEAEAQLLKQQAEQFEQWADYQSHRQKQFEQAKLDADRKNALDAAQQCQPIGSGSACVYPDGKVCRSENITDTLGRFVRRDFRCF